jgi:hypothetical protein
MDSAPIKRSVTKRQKQYTWEKRQGCRYAATSLDEF